MAIKSTTTPTQRAAARFEPGGRNVKEVQRVHPETGETSGLRYATQAAWHASSEAAAAEAVALETVQVVFDLSNEDDSQSEDDGSESEEDDGSEAEDSEFKATGNQVP